MKFNINDNVRVKLTGYGRKVHKQNSLDTWLEYGQAWPYTYYAPKEDAEGWSLWQLWVLMKEFGEYQIMCGPSCFSTEIEIVEGE